MSTGTSSSTHNHPPSPSPSNSTSPSMISPTLPHSPETARQIAEARTYLEASISNIGSTLDASLKSRAQTLHSNSKQLERQQKDVEKATEGLRKENEKLSAVARDGLKKVKELGNVQNWAEMLERDFLVLQETVRLANGGGDSGSGSGSGSWTGSEMSEGEDGEEGRFKDMGVWPLELDDGMLDGAVNEASSSGTGGGVNLDVGESAQSVVDPTVHTDDQGDAKSTNQSEIASSFLTAAEANNQEERTSEVGMGIVMEQSALNLVKSSNHLEDTKFIDLPAANVGLQPRSESSNLAGVGKAAGLAEQAKRSEASEATTLVDSEGDVHMEDPAPEDKGKGKEQAVLSDPTAVVTAQQNGVLESSSTVTAGSITDPSSASVHTSSSVIS